MRELHLQIDGPVPPGVWTRFRRRWRHYSTAGTVAAATAFYVATAAEESVSGLWVEAGGRTVRIHHLGTKVTGRFEPGGGLSIEGRFVSPDTFEGYISLHWETAEMRRRCGDGRFRSLSYVATVDWEDGIIRERWVTPVANEITCARQPPRPQTSTLRRVAR
jgi:hypothetical protein